MHDGHMILGADKAVARLREQGVPVCFVSNGGGSTGEQNNA